TGWPDGGWRAVGTGAIWAVRPDGTGLHRVTTSGLFPAWSPDGRLIAFTRYTPTCPPTVPSPRCEARVEHLYVMNSDGSDVRVLAVDVRAAGSLAWQPRLSMAAPPGTPPR